MNPFMPPALAPALIALTWWMGLVVVGSMALMTPPQLPPNPRRPDDRTPETR